MSGTLVVTAVIYVNTAQLLYYLARSKKLTVGSKFKV